MSKQNEIINSNFSKVKQEISDITDRLNSYIITESIVTVEKDATKGVSPYNTSYGYTNITINADSGVEWKEGASYTFIINTSMVAASAYRNVRVRIGTDGDWKPVYFSSSIAAGSSYFTKAYNTVCIYKSTYQTNGALHIISDNNTTYSLITTTELTTGTATTARSVSAKVLSDWQLAYHDSSKQDALTSGTNIKTINGESILGSGDITVNSGVSVSYDSTNKRLVFS